MSTTKKPTEKQVAFLKKEGIIPPPTRASCSSLISFIIKGNIAFRGKPDKRIIYLKKAQKSWLGKRVKCEKPDKTGTVKYLVAIPADYVRDQIKYVGVKPEEIGYFRAYVEWDGETNRLESLISLTKT